MALKAHMGDWEYYVTTMRADDVVVYVKYAEEVNPNPELDFVLQRTLANRSKKIAEFLRNNTERFFGSLILAVYGGNPKFKPIEIEGGAMLGVGNPGVGVLQFDGREKYYVLDGQHRVAALRSLSESNGDFEEISSELLSVILISHSSDSEGVQRARRLFTNLNRYAVKTNKGVNVALEEDDGYAIVTRRLVREDSFFRDVVKIAKPRRDGGYDLITGEALNAKSDSRWLVTLPTLYECNRQLLGRSVAEKFSQQQQRPDEEELSEAFESLKERWGWVLEALQVFQLRKEEQRSYERGGPDGGHPLVRPIGLRAFTEAAGQAFDVGVSAEKVAAAGAKSERLSNAPWNGLLWNANAQRMESGRARINVAAQIYKMWMGLDIDEEKLHRDMEGFGARL